MNELTDQKDLILSGALRAVSLTDKYDLDADTVFVTGTQALVRLCLLQAQLDSKAGLNTAGFVSGYRGSPLGAVDLQFSSATSVLKDANILFEPGLNEDMAATAVWGTQRYTVTTYTMLKNYRMQASMSRCKNGKSMTL